MWAEMRMCIFSTFICVRFLFILLSWMIFGATVRKSQARNGYEIYLIILKQALISRILRKFSVFNKNIAPCLPSTYVSTSYLFSNSLFSLQRSNYFQNMYIHLIKNHTLSQHTGLIQKLIAKCLTKKRNIWFSAQIVQQSAMFYKHITNIIVTCC